MNTKQSRIENCACVYLSNNNLADGDPIRYRSYCYDGDSGIYYPNAGYCNELTLRAVNSSKPYKLSLRTSYEMLRIVMIGQRPGLSFASKLKLTEKRADIQDFNLACPLFFTL